MAGYNYILDVNYFNEANQHNEDQSKSFFSKIEPLITIFIVVIAAISFYLRFSTMIAHFSTGFFILLFIVVRVLQRKTTANNFKNSHVFNSEILLIINESGLTSTDITGKTELLWDGIQKARRFDDGYFFLTMGGGFYWCPDQSLNTGTLDEVKYLVENNVKDFDYVK